MRVNISYSIELDEIPKKVLSFLEEAHDQVEEAQEFLAAAMTKVGEKNYGVVLEEIAAFRETLGVIDFRMDDCMHILSGYSKALADLAVKNTQSPPTTQEGSALPPEQVAWVKEELKKIQEKKDEPKSDKESG